jgi:hypothetical protein
MGGAALWKDSWGVPCYRYRQTGIRSLGFGTHVVASFGPGTKRVTLNRNVAALGDKAACAALDQSAPAKWPFRHNPSRRVDGTVSNVADNSRQGWWSKGFRGRCS